MLEFYDPTFFCEEEFIEKMRNNLMNKFSIDTFCASDLALEIMELLTLADSNFKVINKYYMNH